MHLKNNLQKLVNCFFRTTILTRGDDMKRNQIDSAYTWDLSSMFASQEAFNTCYQECESLVNALTKQKGHIADTKESFCDFLINKKNYPEN